MKSVAVLSQAKKSECDIAQPNSCIAGDNVPNECYANCNVEAHANISALFITVLCPRLCVLFTECELIRLWLDLFKWAPLLYEHLSVSQWVSHTCAFLCPRPVRFCVPPPCAFLCPPPCAYLCPFVFIIDKPTMELGGVWVPTYRNCVVIFSKLVLYH